MLTIGQIVRHNQRTWAEHTAYVDQYRRVSWRELGLRTDALGHALRVEGVAPGERVAMVATDRIEIAELFAACAKTGAVRVGINFRLAAREVAQLLDDSEPVLFFVEDEHAELAEEALALATVQPRVVRFGDVATGGSEYEEWIERHASSGELEHTPADLLMICYTTGSTGLPKGALYTHDRVVGSMMNIALCEGVMHDDVWLHSMPAGGVPILHMCRNMYHGSTTAIIGRWNAELALELIQRERVTVGVLVPTMLTSLVAIGDTRGADTSSLRQLEYGASPLPPATIREAMDILGCPFLQMYGTTELTGMATMLFPSDHADGLRDKPQILASAGRPLPYVETRIVDEDGRDVPFRKIGELIVRTGLTIPGYWRDEEKFAEVVRDGWLHTGDLGYRDEESYIYLVDRLSFRIKSGGYNIYPVEIENVLAEHPAVLEVGVVGVPDDRWGERVHAAVTLRPGMEADAEELKSFCRGKIGEFKVPKSLDFWPELPKGATGKVLKREIRDRYRTPSVG